MVQHQHVRVLGCTAKQAVVSQQQKRGTDDHAFHCHQINATSIVPSAPCAPQHHLEVLLAYGLNALPQLTVCSLQGTVVARQPLDLPVLLLDHVLQVREGGPSRELFRLSRALSTTPPGYAIICDARGCLTLGGGPLVDAAHPHLPLLLLARTLPLHCRVLGLQLGVIVPEPLQGIPQLQRCLLPCLQLISGAVQAGVRWQARQGWQVERCEMAPSGGSTEEAAETA